MSDAIRYKAFGFDLKELTETGQFTGYAAVFGNLDAEGDVIDEGAFQRTLKSNRGVVPILWQHDRKEPVGWGREASEDGHGVKVRGALMQVGRGLEAQEFMKLAESAGGQVGLSIGYRIPKNGSYDKDGVRHLKEIQLVEYSVVTFPANDQARVTAVKEQADDKEQAMIGFDEALRAVEEREDLNTKRWRIESALRESLDSILRDEESDNEAKKTAGAASIGQYSTAYAAWWADWVDAQADIEKGEKSASAQGMKRRLRKVMDDQARAMIFLESGQRGISKLYNTPPPDPYDTVNRPHPVGGGKTKPTEGSDPEVDGLHSLVDSAKGLTARLRATH